MLESTPPSWCADYVGIPFREHGRDRTGADCWGLVRIVYWDRYGIVLRDFGVSCYRTTKDSPTIARLCAEEARNWERVEDPMEGDVILLKVEGLPRHVGVVVSPGVMLHVEWGLESILEGYTTPMWARRVDSFYRYQREQ
jgi:cell wall-associated NlpC family hydrolase